MNTLTMTSRLFGSMLLGLVSMGMIGVNAQTIDLSHARIVTVGSDPVIQQAARMLTEEISERSRVHLSIEETSNVEGSKVLIGTVEGIDGVAVPEKPEAYGIEAEGNVVKLVGRDSRGAVFAAGRLIRLAEYGDGTLSLNLRDPISTAPDVPYRAHQLAYRNTANTYDAWTVEVYEQYIRDLILFGCNGIELIPSLDPNEKNGPVMTETVRSMNKKLSALIHSYGLEVWLWSAVMADHDEDVTHPEGAQVALEKRRSMFADYPAIDHFFVPGGDDGETPAEHLIPFLKSLSPILKEHHPNAKMWVSNQTFTNEENDYFFNYLEKEDPEWLTGVVYGPWTKMGWEEIRERTPDRFPLRRYPDITHTLRCQYPIQNWDPVFANTVGREPMMPLPEMHRHIYLRYRGVSDGFGTYSDGIHDDFNKALWSALGWDPETDLDSFLNEYGKAWWGEPLAKTVAQGLRMLEENWRGPILKNETISETLSVWEDLAKRCPSFESNWRMQMYLFRARFDAYVQEKAKAESVFEKEAMDALEAATEVGSNNAIDQAIAALAQADRPIAPELRRGIEELGPMLLKSIGYQLSVDPPYQARNPERGALLDWLDQPVNDRPWLEQQFVQIRKMESEESRLKAINDIVHWTDPGPGGFYDNLGAVGQFSHVVYQQSWEEDPSGCHSPRVEFPYYKADKASIEKEMETVEQANVSFKEEGKPDSQPAPQSRQELRMSWQSQVGTHYGTPLKMRYDGLDPNATYRLKVTYAGRYKPSMTLTVNDTFGIHGPVTQPNPIAPVEYPLPHEATKGGELEVEWDLVEGRGCTVAEVWLIVD